MNPPQKKKSPALLAGRIFSVILLAIGLGFIYSGWQDFKGTYRLLSSGVEARARVIGLNVVNLNQRGTRHTFTFEFIHSSGRTLQVPSQHSYFPYFMPYDEEGLLPILYDPADPTNNHIDSMFRIWGHFLMLSGFGALLSAFGALLLVSSLLPEKRIKNK